jgi:hypothetical protein
VEAFCGFSVARGYLSAVDLEMFQRYWMILLHCFICLFRVRT